MGLVIVYSRYTEGQCIYIIIRWRIWKILNPRLGGTNKAIGQGHIQSTNAFVHFELGGYERKGITISTVVTNEPQSAI